MLQEKLEVLEQEALELQSVLNRIQRFVNRNYEG